MDDHSSDAESGNIRLNDEQRDSGDNERVPTLTADRESSITVGQEDMSGIYGESTVMPASVGLADSSTGPVVDMSISGQPVWFEPESTESEIGLTVPLSPTSAGTVREIEGPCKSAPRADILDTGVDGVSSVSSSKLVSPLNISGPTSDQQAVDQQIMDSQAVDQQIMDSQALDQQSSLSQADDQQIVGPKLMDSEPLSDPVGSQADESAMDSESIDEQAMDHSEWTIDYDFTEPKMILQQSEEFKQFENNYLKGCKWSPDGSCLLTNSNDNKMRLYNLPNCLWNHELSIDKLELALTLPEGGLVYDYCWYPMMSSHDPDSCVLATTSRGLPVRLWDAFTGQSRCSYRPYDQMDELVSAKSIAFNNQGDKLYCGFEKVIRVFDTARPGRECQTYNYKSTKKHQVRGQAGIMSSISFHADGTMFAVGTYGKTVGLYSSETNKCVKILRGHSSGVTQVKFLPNVNHVLSGTRKDTELFCWDIRYTRAPAYRIERQVLTNQRIQFDTDRSGRYFVSGQHDGRLSFWDLYSDTDDDSDIIKPVREVLAHSDTVNGASFHPFLPLVASASGQHHNNSSRLLWSDGESDDNDETEVTIEDNSIKLWWVGSSNNHVQSNPIITNPVITNPHYYE